MKLVCEYPIGTLRNMTTANNINAVGLALKSVPGVGQPFLIFTTLPGPVIMADFDDPICLNTDGSRKYVVTSDVAANVALINEMLATPPTAAVTCAI